MLAYRNSKKCEDKIESMEKEFKETKETLENLEKEFKELEENATAVMQEHKKAQVKGQKCNEGCRDMPKAALNLFCHTIL